MTAVLFLTFVSATNGRLKWWFQHTLGDLTPEQLHHRTPLIDDRPIAEVAMHAIVILLGVATVAAGKHWSLEDYPLTWTFWHGQFTRSAEYYGQ